MEQLEQDKEWPEKIKENQENVVKEAMKETISALKLDPTERSFKITEEWLFGLASRRQVIVFFEVNFWQYGGGIFQSAMGRFK